MDTQIHSYELNLVSPEDVRAARRLAGRVAEQLGFSCVAELVQLLASEVLTNVHRHCDRKECVLRFDVSVDGTLRVEVVDHSLDLPCRRRPGPDDTFGRGLAVLDFAARWGSVVHPGECRKTVFFECGAGDAERHVRSAADYVR